MQEKRSFRGRAAINLVLVIDGLRPDSITPDIAPNLHRLRREGVDFVNGHAVFPTVTRVNAASIGTGTQPGRHGIYGNTLYVRAADPLAAFDTADHRNLLRLDAATGGGMVLARSLGEIMAEHGRRLAVVSSGSTGSALLVNPRAPQGIGTLVNGYLRPGAEGAYPAAVSEVVLTRFGAAPVKGGATDRNDDCVAWTQRVLRDYVLPELMPDVVVDWLTEPDHIQHGTGPGSPQTLASIRAADHELGLLLERLAALGLAEEANIFVLSDHGFSHSAFGVDVTAALAEAGLNVGAAGDEVVLASAGQAVLLHVKNRDPQLIRRIVRFLQRKSWAGVLFTAGAARPHAAPIHGAEPGTFALELIHLANAVRAPDVVLTFPWSSAAGPFGLPGSDYVEMSGATGPLAGSSGNHGGMSPWSVRNTFIAWGVDFKRATAVRTPASTVDIAPTLLALLGIADGRSAMDGRVLAEAMAGGIDEEQMPVATVTRFAEAMDGRYRAAIQLTEVAGRRYVDKSWRIA